MDHDRALLFDFDGVVANTFDICYEAMKSLDPLLTKTEYSNRFLGNIHQNLAEINANADPHFDFYASYTPRLLELKIDPHMEEVIRSSSKENYLFVVSSTQSDPIRKFLERHEIDYCFKGIYGKDIHKSKAEKIRMILKKYSLDPSRCLFITDTVGDIREARQCAMDSIAVSWGFQTRETLGTAEPIAIVDSVAELTDLLEKPSRHLDGFFASSIS